MENEKKRTEPRSGRKSFLSKRQWLIIFIIFIGLLTYSAWVVYSPNYYVGKEPRRIIIERGETLNGVIDTLYDAGIVPTKLIMKAVAFIYQAQDKIKAGRYSFPNGLSYVDVLFYLIEGKYDRKIPIHFYSGISLNGMKVKLENAEIEGSRNFLAKTKDRPFLESIGIYYPSALGYLLPKSYEFYHDASAEEIIKTLHNAYRQLMSDSLIRRADMMGYSEHEIITMASIVDAETNIDNEMERIAGVYYNRLDKGMKLQADPTVQFIIEGGWRRLTYKDLQNDSPYNTYLYGGLPPGPINNPGKEALLSALFPEEHGYYYFVANHEGEGHRFSKTYSEHLRKAREYHRWLNQQKK